MAWSGLDLIGVSRTQVASWVYWMVFYLFLVNSSSLGLWLSESSVGLVLGVNGPPFTRGRRGGGEVFWGINWCCSKLILGLLFLWGESFSSTYLGLPCITLSWISFRNGCPYFSKGGRHLFKEGLGLQLVKWDEVLKPVAWWGAWVLGIWDYIMGFFYGQIGVLFLPWVWCNVVHSE